MIPRVTWPAVRGDATSGAFASEAFARLFERCCVAVGRAGPCRVRREPDLFDGRVFTIDEFYAWTQTFADAPWRFFRAFAAPGAPNLRPRGAGAERRVGPGTAQAMVFDSPVATEWPENNLVPFTWFRRRDEPSPAIVLLVPGWARPTQSFEERMCARFLARGVDAGLLTAPFHQARAPRGSRSGEFFISANVFWTIANFRQFVSEIRLLVQHMRRAYRWVGLLGMSSGGFQAGVASDCEDIDFLLSVVTGCRLGAIAWHGALTTGIRRQLEHQGVGEDDLTRAWSIGDQAFLGRHCRARYRKHYIARHDRVVPTCYQRDLWDVYGRPDRVDLPASHYSTYFFLDFIVDDAAAFIRRCLP
jgi:hypothetical protein